MDAYDMIQKEFCALARKRGIDADYASQSQVNTLWELAKRIRNKKEELLSCRYVLRNIRKGLRNLEREQKKELAALRAKYNREVKDCLRLRRSEWQKAGKIKKELAKLGVQGEEVANVKPPLRTRAQRKLEKRLARRLSVFSAFERIEVGDGWWHVDVENDSDSRAISKLLHELLPGYQGGFGVKHPHWSVIC